MNDWQWKKKTALAEQLKFFGTKKQSFISVYASKPRILVKVKSEPTITIDLDKWRRESAEYILHRGQQLGNIAQMNAMVMNQMAVSQSGQFPSNAGGLGGQGLLGMGNLAGTNQANSQFGFLNGGNYGARGIY